MIIQKHPITLWQEQNGIVYEEEILGEIDLSQEKVDVIITSLKKELMESHTSQIASFA